MKASIIIPAYNEEKYIGRTLTAALNQDFTEEFEVIVIDNASTDKTFEEANRFSGVIVLREEKKGVQFARECGRQKAQGEILACLDADSVPPRDWLKKGAAYFDNPKIVGVSGIYDYYDANFFFRVFCFFYQKFIYRFVHFIVQDILKIGAVMLGGNSFIRAKAMEQIKGFNTAIKFYGDDADTGRRLTKVGKVLYKNNIVVKSSARRLTGLNGIKVPFIYGLNFIWILIFKKPFSK